MAPQLNEGGRHRILKFGSYSPYVGEYSESEIRLLNFAFSGFYELRLLKIVFRSEEEAERFRQDTGKYPESEGFKAVSVVHEALAAFLQVHGCTHVGMPELWGEGGGVDRFKAADFIGMLEESAPA